MGACLGPLSLAQQGAVQAPLALPAASMYLVTKSLASHASVPHASQSHHVRNVLKREAYK
jgi:hypothetical protein